MKVCYVTGEDGAGKTTLISIIAYNLFLRNYQVGILDLTDRGRGYFFRFGACDFFALGDGCVEIPDKLLVTLQEISKTMVTEPLLSLHRLPLWPGLKLCLTAPAPARDKLSLARSFLDIYRDAFDLLFIETNCPLQIIRRPDKEIQNRVLVVCSDPKEEWPGKDAQLKAVYNSMPETVTVVLNNQSQELAAATRFLEKNNMGVDYILASAQDFMANATVMEMCKQMPRSRFLKQMAALVYSIMQK